MEEVKTESTSAFDAANESTKQVPSESQDQEGSKLLDDIDFKSLQDKCPAFKAGCPFSESDTKGDSNTEQKQCMFEGAQNLSDVHSKISEMGSSPEGREELGRVLNHIHNVSHSLKEELGDCPVFQNKKGCPFKTVCSDGVPLLDKLANLDWLKLLSSSSEVLNDDTGKEETIKKSDIELSKELKLGTKKVHRAAESVHFIREFMKGRVEQKIYLHFVGSLYYIYGILEEEGEKHKEHPLFKKVYYPKELNRLDTLKEDLRFFYGEQWEDEIRISPATQDYIDRIQEVSKTNPTLLIAHHYTRYLGDLSGGQVLKKIAKKTYKLPENGDGVKFYEFDDIESPNDFKNFYRQELDDINVSKEEADELVEEAKVTFMLNIGLFKELDELSGYTEEIEHTEERNLEPAGSSAPDTKVSEPKVDLRREEEAPVNWLWIIAVAALIFAIVMGFCTRVVT